MNINSIAKKYDNLKLKNTVGILNISTDDTYKTVTLQLGYIIRSKKDETDMVQLYSDTEDGSHLLEGLKITGTYNTGYPEWGIYGYKLEYSTDYLYSISNTNMDIISDKIKALKSINRKLESYQNKYGRITSFSDYIRAIRGIIGITRFVAIHGSPYLFSFTDLQTWLDNCTK